MQLEEKIGLGFAAFIGGIVVLTFGAFVAMEIDEYRIDRENRKKGIFPPPTPIIEESGYDRGYREGYKDGRSALFF